MSIKHQNNLSQDKCKGGAKKGQVSFTKKGNPMSVIRVLHNRENPYVQLNKETLTDSRLSLKARGLWAMCMSKPDNWAFHIKALLKELKEGKSAVYGAINELIENGYCTRFQKRSDDRKILSEVEYVFFEYKATEQEMENLKKSFLLSDFQHADFQHAGFENAAPIETEDVISPNPPLNNNIYILKKDLTKSCAPVPVAENRGSVSKKEFSQEVKDLVDLLKNRVKGHFPGFKEPNDKKWCEEMDRMIRIDSRAVSEVSDMIVWAMEDAFWCKVILSPSNLRKHFDTMMAKRTPVCNAGTNLATNRALSHEVRSGLKRDEVAFKDFIILSDGVIKQSTGEKLNFNLHPAEFKIKLNNIFNINQIRRPVEEGMPFVPQRVQPVRVDHPDWESNYKYFKECLIKNNIDENKYKLKPMFGDRSDTIPEIITFKKGGMMDTFSFEQDRTNFVKSCQTFIEHLLNV